jgi:hypothetical protein
MSIQIKQEGGATTVVLDSEMWILHAAEFHRAVLPLAGASGAVRIDASAVKSIHSSTLQILYALSQAVPDFGVAEASEDFCAAEIRVGLTFVRSKKNGTPVNPVGRA